MLLIQSGWSVLFAVVVVEDGASDGLSDGVMGDTPSDVSLDSAASDGVVSSVVTSSTSAGDASSSSSSFLSSSPADVETAERKRGDERWRNDAAAEAQEGPRRKAAVARNIL